MNENLWNKNKKIKTKEYNVDLVRRFIDDVKN